MATKTIQVKTKYGLFKDIPNTTWKELEPYWPDITASIIEAILEDDFKISDVRKDNPKGFIANKFYWKAHKKNPSAYPLSEAKKFISKLKEKKDLQMLY